MLVSFEEIGEDTVEMVIEREVILKPEYRDLSAREIIKKVREKSRG